MTTFGRALARERPTEAALRDDARSLTWAQADLVLNRVANSLAAQDLGPRRRVAVCAENSVETVLAHLGGIIGSASVVPVGFHHTVPEIEYMLAVSGAALVFVGPETAERVLLAADRLAPQGGNRPVVVGWRCPPVQGRADLVGWDEWLDAASPDEPDLSVEPRPNLMFTSGTTGRPKATELPPAMFVGGATMAEHLERMAGHKFAPFGPHLVVGPLHHTGPLQGVRVPVAGVPVVVQGRFDAAATLANIAAHGIATSVMVPTHLARLLALPAPVRSSADVSSLRHVVHTGAPCPPSVKRAVIDWWGPVLFESYGATEVGTVTSISSQEWLERPTSVGRCLPQFEAMVVDDAGRGLAPGTEGLLCFRDLTGRGISYEGDPEASAAANLAPGVFILGEVGYVDHDGYVHVTDRSADLVLSGGVNVYPTEAERVLSAHPAVADVACIGLPDDEMGERLVALVVPVNPSAPPTASELDEWCRENLAGPKCPRSYRVVATVERTPMGKIDRRRLRSEAVNS